MRSALTQPLGLIGELVALPTVSSLDSDWDQSNKALIDRLANWLSDLGFKVDVKPVETKGETKWNLLARLGPDGKDAGGAGGLVLSGHSDTVPFNAERWKSDPLKLSQRDGRLHGLGTADMKSFLALAIVAAQRFKPGDLTQPLYVLATADEESSMSGARSLGAFDDLHAAYAIIGEPTDGVPIRMHKGVLLDSLRVTGRSAHSSDPASGANALDGMYQVLGALMQYREQLAERYRDPHFEIGYPTMNFGAIHGGDNANRVCGHCELFFDVRTLPGMDRAQLRHEIMSLARRAIEEHGVQVEMADDFYGVEALQTPSQSKLIALAEKVSGKPAGAVAFATEAPFLRALGMDVVVMGPGRIAQAHQPDEYIELAQLDPTVDRLEHMIRSLCCN